MPTFEISTTTYDEDISVIQVALTKIAAICDFEAGFKIAEPVSKLDVLMMSRLFHMILLEGKVVSVEEEFNLISI